MPAPTIYDPKDSYQSAFLAAIRAGEAPRTGNPYTGGFGNVDLSGKPVDRWGFPQWAGNWTSAGPTHAAGAYQFQPGTWRTIAKQYGLDFRKPQDQDAGAWYNAQRVYTAKTGGNLYDALKTGDYASVKNALASEWAFLGTGNSASKNFGSNIAKGVGAELSPGPSAENYGEPAPSFFSDPAGWAGRYFVRGGMILVGIVILGVALWALLSHYNALPQSVALPV